MPSPRAPFIRSYLFAIILAAFLFQGSRFVPSIEDLFLWLPYSARALRYTSTICLIFCFAWIALGVLKAWKQPRARGLRFPSIVALLFSLLLMAPLVTGASQTIHNIPDDAWEALRYPSRVILFSLDSENIDFERDLARLDSTTAQGNPQPDAGTQVAQQPTVPAPPKYTDVFEGHGVLGKIPLEGSQAAAAAAEFRHTLIWILPSPVISFSAAMCFNPRHGLRIESRGHEYDFLLCYECRQMDIFRDGKQIAHLFIRGSPTALNALLTQAHIPIETPPH